MSGGVFVVAGFAHMHVVFGHVFHILRLLFVAKRVPAPFGGLLELVFQPHETVGARHGRGQQAGQFVQCPFLAHVGCIEDGVILDKLVPRADDADGVAVGKVDGDLVSRLGSNAVMHPNWWSLYACQSGSMRVTVLRMSRVFILSVPVLRRDDNPAVRQWVDGAGFVRHQSALHIFGLDDLRVTVAEFDLFAQPVFVGVVEEFVDGILFGGVVVELDGEGA